MTDCRSAALSIDEAQSLTSDYGGLLCCIILMQCAAGHGLAWDAAIPRRKLPPSSAHMLTAQNMRASFWQVILVQDRAAVPPQEGQEYRHGITPPMRNVRNRLFKPLDLPEPAVMRQLALELEQIAKGSAPAGMTITDTEEEYEVDSNGIGSWQAVQPSHEQLAGPLPSRKPQTKSRRGGGAKKQQQQLQQQQQEQMQQQDQAATPETL